MNNKAQKLRKIALKNQTNTEYEEIIKRAEKCANENVLAMTYIGAFMSEITMAKLEEDGFKVEKESNVSWIIKW